MRLIALATAVVLLGLSQSQAQMMTAERFLADSVDQYGPKYQGVEDAIAKFATRDFDGARAALDAAKAANPELPPSGVMMARLLFAAQQGAAAKSQLEQTIEKVPTDPEAWLFLGDMELQSRSFAAAQTLYDKAKDRLQGLQTSAKRRSNLEMRTYAGLATVAEGRGDWQEAKNYITQWLKVDPDHVAGRTRLARAMYKLEDAKTAYGILQKIYEGDDTTTRPEVSMALLYETDNKHANAKQLMTRAAQRDTKTLNTQLAVAKWALDTGELEIAEKACTDSLKIDSTALQAKMYQGMLARYRKQWNKSEQLFIQAHLQSPTNFGANNQLALVLIEQEDEDKRKRAAEFATINAQLYSGNLKNAFGREAMVTLAWINYKSGRVRQAIAGIQRAMQNGAISADSAYFAAKIMHDSKQTEIAKKILEPFLKNTPFFINKPDAEKLMTQLSS